VSNPTLITEDNEPATISIIDRIPIITSTTTPSTTGAPTVSEEVRYKIDITDRAITEDPQNHREIGISIAVTPTLLPDGTIRMKMRPRSAQITGFVQGVGQIAGADGNSYPRVTESMVETLARIPDGDSLVVGGFYGEIQSDDKNKVPLFGDIPVLNFFFKSKETSKSQTSLVFIVTPTSYNPAASGENNRVTKNLQSRTELPYDYHSANPDNPGPGHEPNLHRTLRGMQPGQAPYYPQADELNGGKSDPGSSSKPKLGRHKR
jgi:type II secretory pathway component GspD/PulD (secretin)